MTSVVWEMGSLQNDLMHLKPGTHTSSPAPLPVICLFLKVRNLKYASKNSNDDHKSQSPLLNDWISREEIQSFSFAFCFFQSMQGRKLIAISDLQVGFLSASLDTFLQFPGRRHFGQGQRALDLF